MNPRVASVKTLEGDKLLLTFTKGEQRIFDMAPYLEIGIFKELKEISNSGNHLNRIPALSINPSTSITIAMVSSSQ
ncbi:MAG: DUF2442 domain-containing protein [Bacteroidetes bacterium]|nr:DUF2442 domain-containing protein [Bacteroidota bacterium]